MQAKSHATSRVPSEGSISGNPAASRHTGKSQIRNEMFCCNIGDLISPGNGTMSSSYPLILLLWSTSYCFSHTLRCTFLCPVSYVMGSVCTEHQDSPAYGVNQHSSTTALCVITRMHTQTAHCYKFFLSSLCSCCTQGGWKYHRLTATK